MYPSVLLPQASYRLSALNTSHLRFCKNFLRAGRRVVATPCHLVRRVESRLLLCLLSAPSHFSLHPIQEFASTAGHPPPKLNEGLIYSNPSVRLQDTAYAAAGHICRIIWTTRATFSTNCSASILRHSLCRPGPLHSTRLSKIPLRQRSTLCSRILHLYLPTPP